MKKNLFWAIFTAAKIVVDGAVVSLLGFGVEITGWQPGVLTMVFDALSADPVPGTTRIRARA